MATRTTTTQVAPTISSHYYPSGPTCSSSSTSYLNVPSVTTSSELPTNAHVVNDPIPNPGSGDISLNEYSHAAVRKCTLSQSSGKRRRLHRNSAPGNLFTTSSSSGYGNTGEMQPANLSQPERNPTLNPSLCPTLAGRFPHLVKTTGRG